MDPDIRNRLAEEFSDVIKTIREEKWDAFSEAAGEAGLDPYVALARLLVRRVEEMLDEPMAKKRRKPPKSGNGKH